MSEQLITIRGIDPLLFGDGRPFSDEEGSLMARTLPLPYPSTLAGFLRTRLGNALGWNWDEDGPERALNTAMHGPILLRDGKAVFPAPADAVIHRPEGATADEVAALRHARLLCGSGCNLPKYVWPLTAGVDVKPARGYRFWPQERIAEWLANGGGAGFELPERIEGPPRETRTHVAIDRLTGRSEDGKLYTTELVAFESSPDREWVADREKGLHEWSLLCRLDADKGLDGAGLLGGEGRLAAIEAANPEMWPSCPAVVKGALARAGMIEFPEVRLQLATPALFSGGWRPGWLDHNDAGSPPFCPGVRLCLVSAAVPRRQAVSGWDFRTRGPKPTRWMAPAGSVYLFEVIEGCASDLSDAWLAPVSDDPQDRRDGWGLGLWGIS